MKINSKILWSVFSIGLAATFFYLGTKEGFSERERILERQLDEKISEIKILRNKNSQLSEELTSRGILSYPQGTVVPNPTNSKATIVITLNGTEELEHLELKRSLVYDYSNTSKVLAELSETAQTNQLGTLKTHNPAAFDVPMEQEEVAIKLTYTSGNKHWNQFIWIKKSPDGKIKSFWVIVNDSSEVIDKHIDEGFPRGESGQITLAENRKITYPEIEMNSVFRKF